MKSRPTYSLFSFFRPAWAATITLFAGNWIHGTNKDWYEYNIFLIQRLFPSPFKKLLLISSFCIADNFPATESILVPLPISNYKYRYYFKEIKIKWYCFLQVTNVLINMHSDVSYVNEQYKEQWKIFWQKHSRGISRKQSIRTPLIRFFCMHYRCNMSNNGCMSCNWISWPKSWNSSSCLLLR